jgi:hypothetical protein
VLAGLVALLFVVAVCNSMLLDATGTQKEVPMRNKTGRFKAVVEISMLKTIWAIETSSIAGALPA